MKPGRFPINPKCSPGHCTGIRERVCVPFVHFVTASTAIGLGGIRERKKNSSEKPLLIVYHKKNPSEAAAQPELKQDTQHVLKAAVPVQSPVWTHPLWAAHSPALLKGPGQTGSRGSQSHRPCVHCTRAPALHTQAQQHPPAGLKHIL